MQRNAAFTFGVLKNSLRHYYENVQFSQSNLATAIDVFEKLNVDLHRAIYTSLDEICGFITSAKDLVRGFGLTNYK